MPEWKDEDFGRSAPFYFYLIMKKVFTLIVLCVFSFGIIHAEITWSLSDDGTLTVSGTDMPDYSPKKAPWYSRRQIIEKVVIENGVTSIGENAFYDCSPLTSVTIPNSVTSIGDGAFRGCYWLTSVAIPNSVTSIGENAFYDCSHLTSVTIPNSVTSIGENAFYDCSHLTSVTIGNSVTSIGDYAFVGCHDLTSVTIGNSVTSIGDYAFSECYSLTSVTIGNSVTSIGDYAFPDSKWYDNQPDGLFYVGKVLYCYKGTMPSNTKIDIKEGTTQIRDDAFQGCKGLTSVTIPNSVTNIGERVFSGCSSLASIIVDKGNPYYDSRDDCNAIIETKSNTLISGCKNTIIPNSVTSIGASAFHSCSVLTSLTIPNSVTSIGASAFYGCSGLTSLTIPESVTSIGGSAFDGAKLRNIVIKAKTPPSGGSAFSGQSYYHTTLMIPEGSWDAYAYSDNWYQFINIREMAYNEANLTNSKAYMLKSSNEGSYLFYDSVNDCVASLNETALDDTEENITWMTTEVDGKHYVYNLGAKKFLVADKTNAKTGYRLSDVPASIDIEDGKDAIVFGKSKEFYMVINEKLNVDEGLESQIMTSTGIKGISVDANQPTVTYSVNVR